MIKREVKVLLGTLVRWQHARGAYLSARSPEGIESGRVLVERMEHEFEEAFRNAVRAVLDEGRGR